MQNITIPPNVTILPFNLSQYIQQSNGRLDSDHEPRAASVNLDVHDLSFYSWLCDLLPDQPVRDTFLSRVITKKQKAIVRPPSLLDRICCCLKQAGSFGRSRVQTNHQEHELLSQNSSWI